MSSAPEILRNEAYDQSADAFSFAITLVACFKRGRAYGISESFSLKAVKYEHKRPSIPPWASATGAGCPDRVAELVRACWDEEPGKRPPFAAVVESLELELEHAAGAAGVGSVAAALDAKLLEVMKGERDFLGGGGEGGGEGGAPGEEEQTAHRGGVNRTALYESTDLGGF